MLVVCSRITAVVRHIRTAVRLLTGGSWPFHGGAGSAAPLGPRAVVDADALAPEQAGQDEPRGGGASADRAVGDQLVAAVEALQQRLCTSVRSGTPYEELHDQSHRFVAEALREVGVSRLSPDELVSSGITRAFFPHGLGHALGLVCHDVGCAIIKPRPDNPWLRNTSVIAPRQVFTIEPGIYFIQALLDPLREGKHAAQIDWPLVDALAQLGGVRIEDDLVVEASGIRNLTREQLPTGGGTVI